MKPEMSPISTMTRMRCITSRRRTEVYCMGQSDGAGGRSDLPPRNQAHAFYYLSPPPVPRPVATGRSGRVRSDGYQRCPGHQHGTTGERNHTRSDPAPRHRAGCQVRSQDADPGNGGTVLFHYPGLGTAKEPESFTRKEIADRKDFSLSIALAA